MSPEIIFQICTFGVIPAWILLILLPKWKWTTNIVQFALIPALLSLTYIFIYFIKPARVEGAGMESLNSLVILLSSPHSALIAWLHFLAFDLFVGAWIVRDSTGLSIHPVLVAPCLLLTFAFGPIGLLLYLMLRLALRKKWYLKEGAIA